MKHRSLPAILLLLSGPGCAAVSPPAPEQAAGVLIVETPQDAFWNNLGSHCGSAFQGRLAVEPPGDEMLTGTEALIVHFRECTDAEIRLPFHIEKEAAGTWDRSRTWVFSRTTDGLELRHDHRREDGSEDDNTWYGGHTREPGEANRQEFILAERTAPDGSLLGWRVEIIPGERYSYGTIRGGEWTWRVDFDLSSTVPTPPAPWGHS